MFARQVMWSQALIRMNEIRMATGCDWLAILQLSRGSTVTLERSKPDNIDMRNGYQSNQEETMPCSTSSIPSKSTLRQFPPLLQLL